MSQTSTIRVPGRRSAAGENRAAWLGVDQFAFMLPQ
jgi:hypothetical protein